MPAPLLPKHDRGFSSGDVRRSCRAGLKALFAASFIGPAIRREICKPSSDINCMEAAEHGNEPRQWSMRTPILRETALSYHEPIAIVGIGCRFPGRANDPETFWKLLEAGVDAVTEIPGDRWNLRGFYDPDPITAGQDLQPLGRVCREDRPFRPAVLRDFAAGSGPHGPPATAAARSGLGGARGRRAAARSNCRQPDGRLRRDLQLRLLALANELPRPRRDRRHSEHRRIAEHRREPDLVLLRLSRTERGRRHGLLVGAGGGPPGLPEHLAGRLPAGTGGRCQRACSCPTGTSASAGWACCRRRAVAGPSTPAPAASCGAKGAGMVVLKPLAQALRRRRPRLRDHPRDRDQPGRPHARHDGAEPGGPGGPAAPGVPRRARQARRDPVRRGPWHRHPGGRPDRGAGLGRVLVRRPARRTSPA